MKKEEKYIAIGLGVALLFGISYYLYKEHHKKIAAGKIKNSAKIPILDSSKSASDNSFFGDSKNASASKS